MNILLSRLPVLGSLVVCGALLGSCGTMGKPKVTKARQHFEKLDVNKDGKWSYSEFLNSPSAKKSSSPKTLFNKIDTNGDGYITAAELQMYRKYEKGH